MGTMELAHGDMDRHPALCARRLRHRLIVLLFCALAWG
jgi:hypothetical protein